MRGGGDDTVGVAKLCLRGALGGGDTVGIAEARHLANPDNQTRHTVREMLPVVGKCAICWLSYQGLEGQVTNHGGLESVVSGKKWTEVSQPFKFPPSFTSKSFTLRKMYSRLLHDFEQVYYHRNTGPPTVPYGMSPSFTFLCQCSLASFPACLETHMAIC